MYSGNLGLAHSFDEFIEVARRLRRDGRPGPSALLVSGRGAPHLLGRAPRLGHLPAPELVLRTAERFGGIPNVILGDVELTALLGKALQGDLAVIERYEYVPEEPVECPIAAFGGQDDTWVTHNELEAWRHHTRAAFSCAQFPGDHFYFRTLETQQSLLARLRECSVAVTGDELNWLKDVR